MLAVLLLLRKTLRKTHLFFFHLCLCQIQPRQWVLKTLLFIKWYLPVVCPCHPYWWRSAAPTLAFQQILPELHRGHLSSTYRKVTGLEEQENCTANTGLVYSETSAGWIPVLHWGWRPNLSVLAAPRAINVVVKTRENPSMQGSWAGSGAPLAWQRVPYSFLPSHCFDSQVQLTFVHSGA